MNRMFQTGAATLQIIFSAATVNIITDDVSAKPADGKALLQTHCARCHAIGTLDESPLKHAPPLRDIYRLYPTERLEFELSEGIGSRHSKMPQIQFSTEQVDMILRYLGTLSSSK